MKSKRAGEGVIGSFPVVMSTVERWEFQPSFVDEEDGATMPLVVIILKTSPRLIWVPFSNVLDDMASAAILLMSSVNIYGSSPKSMCVCRSTHWVAKAEAASGYH
jgi:hypothetical protein